MMTAAGPPPTGDAFKEQQDGQKAEDRTATLVRLIDYARRNDIGTLAFMLLVLELELVEELRQLAATSAERQRLVEQALQLVELKLKLDDEGAPA